MNLRSRQRSAYWRGEKMIIFCKRGIIALSIFIFIAGVVSGLRFLADVFPVENILVSGNNNLDKSDIIGTLNIRSGESLFRLSLGEVETRLKRNAWIKKVSLRKQFPDTIMIDVEEAVPKALLRFKEHMFLVGKDGNILEEIQNKSTPFLPVIVGINPKKDRGGIKEALKLIDVLAEKDILSSKESVEVMLKAYGLVMNMDGEYVKVGYGKYTEKLGRWKNLEEEIRRKNINVDYVDLRFNNEVIVKTLKKTKKGRTANVK